MRRVLPPPSSPPAACYLLYNILKGQAHYVCLAVHETENFHSCVPLRILEILTETLFMVLWL
jgi:hypothetical protein